MGQSYLFDEYDAKVLRMIQEELAALDKTRAEFTIQLPYEDDPLDGRIRPSACELSITFINRKGSGTFHIGRTPQWRALPDEELRERIRDDVTHAFEYAQEYEGGGVRMHPEALS